MRVDVCLPAIQNVPPSTHHRGSWIMKVVYRSVVAGTQLNGCVLSRFYFKYKVLSSYCQGSNCKPTVSAAFFFLKSTVFNTDEKNI